MLYIVPSRGRPRNIEALLESWEETNSNSQIWVCVDLDDEKLNEYEAITLPKWATLRVGPRLRLGRTLNNASAIAVHHTDHTIIGFMGDDHRPRTYGWDQQIQETIDTTGAPAVVYGNDLIQGRNLATAVAMSADIIRALGYMVPPGMTHLYIDNAWMEIGKELGTLIYRDGIVIEHVHPIAGKAQWDELYREVNSGEQYNADWECYAEWLADHSWREKLYTLKEAYS